MESGILKLMLNCYLSFNEGNDILKLLLNYCFWFNEIETQLQNLDAKL